MDCLSRKLMYFQMGIILLILLIQNILIIVFEIILTQLLNKTNKRKKTLLKYIPIGRI